MERREPNSLQLALTQARMTPGLKIGGWRKFRYINPISRELRRPKLPSLLSLAPTIIPECTGLIPVVREPRLRFSNRSIEGDVEGGYVVELHY